jgi:hypothetical protein
VDVDELKTRAATWEKALEQATTVHRWYGKDVRADLDLRKAAGELVRLIRERGPSVRGVVLEGRLYLDSTDPLQENFAGTSGAVPWFITRIDLTRPSFHQTGPWQIVDADPPSTFTVPDPHF